MNVLSFGPKASNIPGISDAISPRYIRKNPRSMCARVLHVMTQFFLKIAKLSHIMGTAAYSALIARAYSLHTRLWLLFNLVVASSNYQWKAKFKSCVLYSQTETRINVQPPQLRTRHYLWSGLEEEGSIGGFWARESNIYLILTLNFILLK